MGNGGGGRVGRERQECGEREFEEGEEEVKRCHGRGE